MGSRVSGMEAARISLTAGFLNLALSGAADAFPEEAAASWGIGSAFSDGFDTFTGVGVALGAGGTIGAEVGTT